MPLYLPSRHRAIKPSSHWAMYHRTITAYQWAFVPSYHLAIVPLSHVPRANVPSNCHHPSYHRAMYHCVIALYHCVIEPLYHQAIVPLCNCIIEPWTTIQRRFLACRRSKGLRSKLIVVSSSLFVGFCCRHRVGSPSLRRGLSLLLLLFIVAVVSRCCCRCLSSLLSPVSIWLLCLSAVPHFDAPNQSTNNDNYTTINLDLSPLLLQMARKRPWMVAPGSMIRLHNGTMAWWCEGLMAQWYNAMARCYMARWYDGWWQVWWYDGMRHMTRGKMAWWHNGTMCWYNGK